MFDLVYRLQKGSPRTLVEEDANLSTIQGGLERSSQLLFQSNVPIPRVSINTSQDAVALTFVSVTIPAGTMGINSKLVVIVDWDYPNTTSTKFFGVNWGGGSISGPSYTGTSVYSAKLMIEIQNLGQLNSQGIMNSSTYGSAGARQYKTIDTSYDAAIDITAKWSAAVSSETLTLVGYSIRHYPGPL